MALTDAPLRAGSHGRERTALPSSAQHMLRTFPVTSSKLPSSHASNAPRSCGKQCESISADPYTAQVGTAWTKYAFIENRGQPHSLVPPMLLKSAGARLRLHPHHVSRSQAPLGSHREDHRALWRPSENAMQLLSDLPPAPPSCPLPDGRSGNPSTRQEPLVCVR